MTWPLLWPGAMRVLTVPTSRHGILPAVRASASRASALPCLPAPQFGRQFDELATDPNAPSVERDDFAIELAMLDE